MSERGRGRFMRLVRRLAAALLRMAPPAFRDRYGDEYRATLEARLDAVVRRGAVPALLLAVREVVGVSWMVIRMRAGRKPAAHGRMGYPRGGEAAMLDLMGQDVRQATRSLLRNPGFTVAAVVVLALGIGATTAIFSAVNSFLFRPLPFEEEERLALLYETNPEFGWADVDAAPANALDWREQVEAFEDVAAYREVGVGDIALQLDGEPVLVQGTTVTGNFFDVLGVRALHGRGLTWDETWIEASDVVVLSHHLWVERFGADPAVVGATVPFGGAGTPYRIVGVMPEGFSFPHADTDLWYPYGWDPAARDQVWFRRAHFVRAVARLAPGTSFEEADAQLQVVVDRLQTEYPATNRVMGAGMTPIRDFLVRGVRTPLMVLLGAVGVLLALACVNVANLMLVRSHGRVREVAVRRALGAGRGRVVRHELVESVLIALLGGGAGLALGWWGVRGISGLTPLGIDGATEVALDARVLLFTAVVSGFSAALCALAPALRSAGRDISDVLRESGRSRTSGKGTIRASRVLVAGEVALALLLVVGAGLMVRSSWLLRQVEPGFAVDDVLAIDLTVPTSRYPNRDQVLAFWDRFLEELEARPGIERAGTVAQLPLAGTSWTSQLKAEGWPPEREGLEIIHRRADRGYFEAVGTPLVRGRLFEAADEPGGQPVLVVNETLAREHFPGEDPIGQRVAFTREPTPESTWWEIVGIVADQHQVSPGTPVRAEVFENRDQDWSRQLWVVMRTSVDPVAVVPAARDALATLDDRVPIAEIVPLRDVWARSMNREQLLLTLLTVFGATALLLATVGVYGVTAQAARGRTQEIGIRMALGASEPEVVRMMVRQGTAVIAPGLAVGPGVALLTTRALGAFLYAIEPNDPRTLAAVVALLGAAAVAACWVPARRASSVDPVNSLRAE